jgi:hypothetical protein
LFRPASMEAEGTIMKIQLNERTFADGTFDEGAAEFVGAHSLKCPGEFLSAKSHSGGFGRRCQYCEQRQHANHRRHGGDIPRPTKKTLNLFSYIHHVYLFSYIHG